MSGRNYTCENCGGVFEAGWTEEEKAAEYNKKFIEPIEDAATICDDCYQKFNDWLKSPEGQEAIRELGGLKQ